MYRKLHIAIYMACTSYKFPKYTDIYHKSQFTSTECLRSLCSLSQQAVEYPNLHRDWLVDISLYLPSAPVSPLGPCCPVSILLLMMSCSHLEALVRDVELVTFCGSASPAYYSKYMYTLLKIRD